ncbi:myrosinase 1-like [Coccinella septempunctata]|uniref:myrosinase 1-like n=1 Tax=Coccinella septempunctata TaxID=41139 RepID=UPI001D07BA77|nr:myrosinase 1-like [Coccinella septempunctata]
MQFLAELLILSYFSIHFAHAQNIFPDHFRLGVASASYQIEGGWNASDKGENIWDRLTHEHPEVIKDNSTGDVACDSYHLWKKDVEILKNLGVDYYRFSISWTRLLPTGRVDKISSDGLKYYNDLIDSLLENKIEPVVTLYHWDLPQALQYFGGWTNLITSDFFAQYARLVFSRFGDRVKTWITINEPYSICETTYGDFQGAPLIHSPGIGDYLCGKTILVAHSKAFHIYDKEFREKQGGKIGITIDTIWAEPRTNKSEDVEAAEREMQMSFGWWAHPIFSTNGDYPEIMKSRIEERSRQENFVESRLPSFTKEEILNLRGSADFLGLNHYNTKLISNTEFPIGEPSFQKDKGTSAFQDPNWKPNKHTVPWGFRKLLNWIKREYDNPLVYITENGFPDEGQLQDVGRVIFHKEMMKAMLQAIGDGCNIQSYTVWSIMDNMEWRDGYTIKFGLYQVDFNNPNRTRTPKASAKFFKTVIETRTIPENITMFIE